MSTEVIVYILTALAALVILLTRVRLGGGRGAGRHHIGHGLLAIHTGAGALALVSWLLFLLSPEDSITADALVGIIALGLWWIVVIVGLMVLLRWLPTRGRHASTGIEDSWSQGPGLSVLAHVGMLVGVCVFTWAYLTSAV